jgi:hypothetical protein
MITLIALACVVSLSPDPLHDRDGGVEFVTVGDPGNPAYDGMDPQGFFTGRGSVDYTYRIGLTELTTQNWVDFLNAMRFTEEPFAWIPRNWGAAPVQAVPYWRFEAFDDESAMKPLGGLMWRALAWYCNWLHHGQPIGPDSIRDGAYDVSTFFIDSNNGGLQDQATRSEGARFWIPSQDEWMKAAYYDPNRHGPGESGWWTYPHMSDEAPEPGLPTTPGAQTSAGTFQLFFDFNEAFDIPLKSYKGVESSWGLMDVSGAGQEWSEEWDRVSSFGFLVRRTFAANAGTTPSFAVFGDRVYFASNAKPDTLPSSVMSARIASMVPPTADFTEPWWECTFGDVTAYLAEHIAGDASADIAAPVGVLDTADLIAFVDAFAACD